jgi:hypothetical protein
MSDQKDKAITSDLEQHPQQNKPVQYAVNPDKKSDLSPRDAELQSDNSRQKNHKASDKNSNQNKIIAEPINHGQIKKSQRKKSFLSTMQRVQKQLSAPEKIFSKFIHLSLIESIIEVISATIARPNAILAGSVVAFIFTMATYAASKIIGYSLSGYESLLAFIAGWSVGLIYDYIKSLFNHKDL